MPVDWLQVPLGEVCRIEIGGTPSRNVPRFWADKHSGYPWLSIADLKASRVYDTAERITDAGVRNSNVKPIPANTPVMSFKLTIGRAAVAGVNMYSNEAIAAFHADSTVIAPGWLFYELPRAALRGISDTAVKGSTLNKAKLRKLPLELPPLPEQRQIAEILDTLDEAIRKTEQIIAKLQQVKQGLLHDLLTRGIDDNGELRDPDRHPEQFKDSPLGRIPKGWEVGAAAEYCDRLTVGVVNSATHAYRESGVPFIRSQNVKPNRIETADLLFVSEAFNRQQAKSVLRAGDVVIVRTGYPGTAAVVPETLDGANCFSLVIARPGSGLASEYLSQYLNSESCKAAIDRLHFGSAQHNFNVGEMRRLPLALPPPDEQMRILQHLNTYDLEVSLEKDELRKLRLLKSGLMEDLLTGRVRVTKLLEQAAE